MIKNLRKKIFLIIVVFLTILIVGAIIAISYFNYKNTIDSSIILIDRISNRKISDNELQEPPEHIEDKKNNEIPEEIFDTDIYVEGAYYFNINEYGEIKNKSENIEDTKLEEYAKKIYNKNTERGIIGNYIYSVKKGRNNEKSIILMENEKTINHLYKIIVYFILIGVIAIILIILIAIRISNIIVKPVEETFEKQKQFISDASHELKTPLAVIEANSDVLETNIGKNKWLGYIQNEIQSMDKLINELLLLAKIENIDSIEKKEEFYISEEIEKIVSMFESLAFERNLKIKRKIQKDIKFNGKKEDIEHILSTLIDNAIKHSKDNKNIIVELIKEKNYLIIKVKNYGDRIKDSDKEKIFERFYRVDKARNRNEKRYGLGLAICKSTIEKYKGKIKVDYKNNYTIFEVILPN